jgi:hypothetical protein
MDRTSEMYEFIRTLVNFRIDQNLWSKYQVQRYVDENLYAFTRENILALFTNSDNFLRRTIFDHAFSEGTKLCNIFNISDDCIIVKNAQMDVTIAGNVKIYIIS